MAYTLRISDGGAQMQIVDPSNNVTNIGNNAYNDDKWVLDLNIGIASFLASEYWYYIDAYNPKDRGKTLNIGKDGRDTNLPAANTVEIYNNAIIATGYKVHTTLNLPTHETRVFNPTTRTLTLNNVTYTKNNASYNYKIEIRFKIINNSLRTQNTTIKTDNIENPYVPPVTTSQVVTTTSDNKSESKTKSSNIVKKNPAVFFDVSLNKKISKIVFELVDGDSVDKFLVEQFRIRVQNNTYKNISFHEVINKPSNPTLFIKFISPDNLFLAVADNTISKFYFTDNLRDYGIVGKINKDGIDILKQIYANINAVCSIHNSGM